MDQVMSQRCSPAPVFKVLWSLGYEILGKTNVLLLHLKLKVKILQISPCLTAYAGLTLELLVIHFSHKKTGYF